MGWKKADAKVDPKVALKGNDDFKITPEITKKINEFRVDAAFTPEDAAFEAELQSLGKDMPSISDNGPVQEVTKTREYLEHLRDFMDDEYKPASTMAELNEQVHMAKGNGAQAVEATEALIKSVFIGGFDKMKETVGYGLFHDVRVYIAGMFDENKAADKQTMEQRLFPKG